MPSDRDQLALFDIRDNVFLVRQFTEGLTQEAFAADLMRFYAVTHSDGLLLTPHVEQSENQCAME